MADKELEAMGVIANALDALTDEERMRVFKWAGDRFLTTSVAASSPSSEGVQNEMRPTESMQIESAPSPSHEPDVQDAEEVVEFEHFAELFDAASPTTEPQRLLVAAYWAQHLQGEQSFGSAGLNKLLKDLGHGATHTSDSMEALIRLKPAQILQLKKSGKSQQARKTYKMTRAGEQAVQAMVASGT